MPSDLSHLIFGTGNLRFEGLVEHCDAGRIGGWVWMPAAPECRVTVELVLDGKPVAAGVADSFRGDLAAGGRGDGRYGFLIPLPFGTADKVEARIANTGLRLPSVRLEGSAAGGRIAKGAVDHAVGLTVKGWCWIPSEPKRAVTINAAIDDQIVATAKADQYRSDVANAGIGDGCHAFVLRLPLWLADGTPRQVALSAEDGTVLIGSPIVVQAFAEGPKAVLDSLASQLPDELPKAAIHALALLGTYLDQVEELLPQSLPWKVYPRWRTPLTGSDHPPLPAGSLTLAPEGDAAILLDHGAVLLPGALSRALEVFRRSGADLLYADAEAEISLGLMPWFRPDWSYDLFLAQDYTRGLVLLRPALADQVGPGASLAEVKTRTMEAAAPGKILHLPEVLTRLTAEPEDSADWLAAIGNHLARRRIPAVVEPIPAGRRVRWPRPDPAPSFSLIIPTRDGLDLLSACIDSIRRLTAYPAYEIIVIDNQSRQPETLRYLASGAAAGIFRVLPHDAPFNFSAMNNAAARMARGDILAFVNNDVELLTPDWLEQAAGYLARPEIGALGVKLRFPNGMIQHGGVVLGVGGLAENAYQHLHADEEGYFNRTRVAGNYSAVTAACLFVRTRLFAEIGGFDAENLPVAFNDVDLCLRLRERGHFVVWTPDIELTHHESVSRGRDASPERRARAFKEEAYMRQRWRQILMRDPYYNPNLNLDQRPFTGLAFPPRHRWGGPWPQ